MTALSIIIPDDLAEKSSMIAKSMHISRAQFVRLAIENEIKTYSIKKDQDKMLIGFKAIKQHAEYQKEIDELEKLDDALEDNLFSAIILLHFDLMISRTQ